jgi:COP9 signalosome complex subunit 2
MTSLVAAYQDNNIHEAEKILKENKATIMDDPFIADYIADVLRSLRTEWIMDVIHAYSRIRIDYLARQLRISREEVEDIVVTLVLDGKIQGKIDQKLGILELFRQYVHRLCCPGYPRRISQRRPRSKQLRGQNYFELTRWSVQIKRAHLSVISKASSSGLGSQPGAVGVHGFGENDVPYMTPS